MTAIDDCRVVLTEQNGIKDLFTWERKKREHKMVGMERQREGN